MVPPTAEELVTVFVVLDEAEHQLTDVEDPTSHPTAVVPMQRLLTLGQAEEGNIARFI